MDYNNQKFIEEFKKTMLEIKPENALFVCSQHYDRYGYRRALDEMNIKSAAFTDFEPCPEVSSVEKGISFMNENGCDFIIAVGGGSAIDTAKGIKYYSEKDIEILAVATTAGTGAEVTRFSVLYRNGDKDSVRSYNIIPEYQIFDYTALKSLPYEQRVVTGLDAFVHTVEAYWSDDANDESRAYSKEALRLFKAHYASYLDDDEHTYEPMMKCSMLAGRAINIAQTTAAHAFSYKLHKLKNYRHGHAVAVCLVYIWQYMLEKGDDKLKKLLAQAEEVSGFTPLSLKSLLSSVGLETELTMTEAEFSETVNGVDAGRLKNHPMKFTADDIKSIYEAFITVL